MINWAEFFESVSPVDAIMRAGSDFAAMDFPTRDLYRRAIEEIARGSGHDEVAVAERAIEVARRAGDVVTDHATNTGRESDPGYYLISNGRRRLKESSDVAFRSRHGFSVSAQIWA